MSKIDYIVQSNHIHCVRSLSHTGIRDLDEVIKILHSNQFPSSNWQELGLQLGLYYSTLQDIDAKYMRDPKKCLTECLAMWFQKEDKVKEKGDPSWAALALGMEAIGYHRVAVKIKCL